MQNDASQSSNQIVSTSEAVQGAGSSPTSAETFQDVRESSLDGEAEERLSEVSRLKDPRPSTKAASDGSSGSLPPSQDDAPTHWQLQRQKWLSGTLYPTQTPLSSPPLPLPSPSPPSIHLASLFSPSSSLSSSSSPSSSSSNHSNFHMAAIPFLPSTWTSPPHSLGKIYSSLMDQGKRLRDDRRLRLSVVVGLLRVGWVRDGTWPVEVVEIKNIEEQGEEEQEKEEEIKEQQSLNLSTSLNPFKRNTMARSSNTKIGGKGVKNKAKRFETVPITAPNDPFFKIPPEGAVIGSKDGLEVWSMTGGGGDGHGERKVEVDGGGA